MCGLIGELYFKHPTPLSILETASERIAQRGPDSYGWYQEPPITFGHRRLQIMDLSSESHQPMVDTGLGLSIVFNGAIYNYPDIRERLIKEGFSFSSTGDTEVVLKAYAAWGVEAFEQFNGMFAIAIWDRRERSLLLARDRLGIKPLYYSKMASRVAFASSLDALLQFPDIDKSIDADALQFYFSFHSIVPAPKTLLCGIKKVEPGHYLKIDTKGHIQNVKWWSLKVGRPLEGSQADIEQLLLDSLRKSVKRRHLAALPVGALLSGGLDSSLLVGLMAEISSTPIKTFSIGFEDSHLEQGHEFEYSNRIAEHFSTEHHRWRVTNAELLGRMPEVIRAMSEPMMSHDCIGFYVLSEAVSKQAKVVLSGQGADEVFAGYHWYPPLLRQQNPEALYQRHFKDRSFEELKASFGPSWSISKDIAGEFILNHFQSLEGVGPVNKALHIDSTVMLVDDPVKRVDNMTMAHGLEARVPFLDHELVELAFRIPESMKLADGGKGILKQVARQIIPHEVIDRPKGYFPVPILKHLSGSVLDWVTDTLRSQKAKERGIIQNRILDAWIQQPEEYLTPLRGSKLWQVSVLELWLQHHGL